jgi:alpha,alpha-trehalase
MNKQAFLRMEELSPLYEAVQLSNVFPDSKFFVDTIPRTPVSELLEMYRQEKDKPGFKLSEFVRANFQFPSETGIAYQSKDKTLNSHLQDLWDVLSRRPDEGGGTLIPLPYPYIVPGGRFREVYYWDSYFTMLGLQVSGRTEALEDMVRNFAYLIDTIGHIPNGNRSYYLGRSQPPFFALMLTLLAEEKGEPVLGQYLPQLEKEYAYWMDGAEELTAEKNTYRRVVRMPDGCLLNRYWDDECSPRPEAYEEDTVLAARSDRKPETVYRDIRAAAESGWDFSSRWFRDGKNMHTIQTTSIIPVDLNCLLLFMETLLCTIYEKSGSEKFNDLLMQAGNRKKAIDKYCWNTAKGFYFDYQFADGEQTDCYSLAGVFPLFVTIADYDQSCKVAEVIQQKFLKQGGLYTTLNHTGQQWDAPNGWAPLQWIAFKGLNKVPYLHCDLAQTIRKNWMQANEKVYAATGKMTEKYNVENPLTEAGGGEYPNQDGFGWTNGVYLKFASL